MTRGLRSTRGGGQHDLARYGASRVASYVAGDMIPPTATATRSTTATYTASVSDNVAYFRPGFSTASATIARTTTATYTRSV